MNEETSGPLPNATAEGLIRPRRFKHISFDRQNLIKFFFSGNAAITIIVLILIMVFLLREGVDFLPTYQKELAVYRKAGLEFCDFVKKPLSEQLSLLSTAKRALNAEVNAISGKDKARRDAVYLLKQQVEDKTVLDREPLEAALAAPGATPESLKSLRQAVLAGNAAAVAALKLPDIFNAEEKKLLASDLSTLQPDVAEFPPFIKSLIEKASKIEAEAQQKHAAFVSAVDAFEEAAEPITALHDEMEASAKAIKEEAVQLSMSEDKKKKLTEAAAVAKTEAEKKAFLQEADATSLTPIDFSTRIEPIKTRLADYEKLLPAYTEALNKAAAAIPKKGETAQARHLLAHFHSELPTHLKHVQRSVEQMKAWDVTKPVPLLQSLTAFLFGGDWVTNSSWQDFYGVVPLFTGSLLIAIIALIIAMPLSVAAAIYTNQFASLREQEIIKPTIEFIQAIPSVVLGFIGIAVLGDLIKTVGAIPWLSWVPGFPVQERLNIFNAGCLLALMTIPTIFSLAEDAIQNVPRAFSEASEALGATKLQTVLRVIVPAAISGILSAVLLGLGRIIGETMVVLLVAGNRIAIPNFSDGLGVVFQPAHTLTGIIAQELGEVSRGSSHWQALFMVGILLFFIALTINYLARLVAKKFALPKI